MPSEVPGKRWATRGHFGRCGLTKNRFAMACLTRANRIVSRVASHGLFAKSSAFAWNRARAAVDGAREVEGDDLGGFLQFVRRGLVGRAAQS